MIYINAGESGVGLGKSKLLRSIQIKKVSLKNAVKAVKFAAPIAAGFIPVGGGVASKLLNSKVGKVVSEVKSSKLAKKAISLSKTKVGALAVNNLKPVVDSKMASINKLSPINVAPKLTPVKSVIPKKAKKTKKLKKGSKGAEVKKLQESLGVEPDGDFGPKTEAALQQATGAKSVSVDQGYSEAAQATPSYASESETQAPETTARPSNATPAYVAKEEEAEPVGELTPVKGGIKVGSPNFNVSSFDTEPAKKDNTLLYVGGVVAVGTIAYLATKKSK